MTSTAGREQESGVRGQGSGLPTSLTPDSRPLTPDQSSAFSLQSLAGRLWHARGFFGGLIAIGLAAAGQQTLIDRRDGQTANAYYVAAIVILIASLLHPALRRLGRRKPASASQGSKVSVFGPKLSPAAAEPGAQSLDLGGSWAGPSVEAVQPSGPTEVVHSAGVAQLPTRPAAAPKGSTALKGTLPSRSSRFSVLNANVARGRSGLRTQSVRRITVWGGTALAVALAAGSAWILSNEIDNPLGGWLWAVSLVVLLLTFVGVEGWPRGNGLLPGPRSDFFGKGVPNISPRWEALLIAIILLVGLGLRLWNLEYHPGIFGDEGERGMDARGINEGNPANIFGYGWWGVPNLYFYIVAAMLRIFGDNMTGDRMLSVISGVVTIWFVYRTARLLWGPRAGLIAGAMLAMSALAIQFSRIAGESTPTGALWAGGFYYFFLALRHRRPLDWALAGTFWGFSLYFYAAGKLIIPIAAAVLLYCLVRWHINAVKRYALGMAIFLLAFGVTFLPIGILSAKDNWQSFTGRAQETSIFSPSNQQTMFERYSIPYDPSWKSEPVTQAILSNPGAWAQLLYRQMRQTVEVIYQSGDPTAFYQIHEHNGSMLPPLWAALALLGLAYGAWKVFDARFGLANVWFWGGMMAAALTIDTPSVQRLVVAWPAL
ncbi:MAG: ArnT family glycosyltransferase, partial [Chloroflexia bacterium]